MKRLICGLISVPSSHPSNLFTHLLSVPHLYSLSHFPSSDPAFTFIQFFPHENHYHLIPTLIIYYSLFHLLPIILYSKDSYFPFLLSSSSGWKERLESPLVFVWEERDVNLSTHPIIMNVTSDGEILASIVNSPPFLLLVSSSLLLLFRFLLHKKSFLHHSSSLFSFIKMAFCQKVISSAFVILLWIYPSPLFSLHPLFLSPRLSLSLFLSPSVLKIVSFYHSLLKDVLVS